MGIIKSFQLRKEIEGSGVESAKLIDIWKKKNRL